MQTPRKTRVLLVEDHHVFARSMELIFERTARFEVSAVEGTLTEGRELVSGGLDFDLAVVDLMLPDGDGTELVREIKKRMPENPVLVLSSLEDLSPALEAGADEALSKEDASLPKILRSVERLLAV